MVFKGYTDPALDVEAFDDDGWFRTGDLGHLDPDGHVVLTGRLKDVIIRKGENISAKEIEDLLYQHPKVGDVAVIGLPDRERGERVCAVVETATGAEPLEFAEMVAYLKDHELMVQKIPEQLEVVEALPRNNTLGKVLKTDLRDQFRDVPWSPPARDRRPGPASPDRGPADAAVVGQSSAATRPSAVRAGGGQGSGRRGRSTAKVPLATHPGTGS